MAPKRKSSKPYDILGGEKPRTRRKTSKPFDVLGGPEQRKSKPSKPFDILAGGKPKTQKTPAAAFEVPTFGTPTSSKAFDILGGPEQRGRKSFKPFDPLAGEKRKPRKPSTSFDILGDQKSNKKSTARKPAKNGKKSDAQRLKEWKAAMRKLGVNLNPLG